jgi:hypothetical protein
MNAIRMMSAIATLLAGVTVASAQSQAPQLPPAAAGRTTPGTAQRPATNGAAGATITPPSAPNPVVGTGDPARPAAVPGTPAIEPNPSNR